MRSLAVPFVLACPLVVACGDVRQPDDDPALDEATTDITEVAPEVAGGEGIAARALEVSFDAYSPSCDAPVVAYRASARYAGGGAPANVRCAFWFDDGRTSESCEGAHELPDPGPHVITLEVTDLETGARGTITRSPAIEPPIDFDIAVDAPACGLELSFNAAITTSSAITSVAVSPPELVVGGTAVFGQSANVAVLQPGSYDVTFTVDDLRPNGVNCGLTATRTVEVVACPEVDPPHEHEPGCGHT